jgi:predicted flap endonuclease-1-like 5' DNA nuclease
MPLSLAQLKGMTPEIAAKLKQHAITNSDKLRAAIDTPAQRNALAQKLGITERSLLELGNRADLSRIKGVGSVYSDLLEFAGVDTVAELAQRVPENLHEQILSVADKHSVQRTPSLKEVQDWVAQAKSLPRGIEY